jgi:excisionase family DNA binding protein
MRATFLTVKQVAEQLRLSEPMVYLLCKRGDLGHHRFGNGRGTIRITEEDLAAFVERCKANHPSTNAAGLKHIKDRSSTRP